MSKKKYKHGKAKCKDYADTAMVNKIIILKK